MGGLPTELIAIPTYPKQRGRKSAITDWAHYVGSSSGLTTIVVMTLFQSVIGTGNFTQNTGFDWLIGVKRPVASLLQNLEVGHIHFSASLGWGSLKKTWRPKTPELTSFGVIRLSDSR